MSLKRVTFGPTMSSSPIQSGLPVPPKPFLALEKEDRSPKGHPERHKKRHFRNMLSRMRRNYSSKIESKRGGEMPSHTEEGNDFVKVVLQRTFPYADKEGEDAKLGRRKRRTKSVPRTKRQMRVVAPHNGVGEQKIMSENDDFWGPAGRCRSLEVVGVRSVFSSRVPSRSSTPSRGSFDSGRDRKSKEILHKLKEKLDVVKRQTSGSHPLLTSQAASEDSLIAVDSLNEMSTLVSQLNSMIVGTSDSDLIAEPEPVHFYQGADRVDEDIKCETVKATKKTHDAESMTDKEEEEGMQPTSNMPDVIQTYSTSQQTTPYGIPHYDLSEREGEMPPVLYDADLLIGRGSFSNVYEGTFHRTKVAVKVFDEKKRRSYDNERELLLNLRHPNIVQLLASCEGGKSQLGNRRWWALVMDLLPGGSLREYLEDSEEPLAAKYTLEITKDLCSALVHLHSLDKPILHLDVKSGNVLLDSPPSSSSNNNNRCRAVLCDFGLSRRLSHRDSTVSLFERLVGTPAWMAPEVVARQDRVGLAADIYGAAMVTWEMTSGRKPYEGLDFKEICDSVLLGCLPPIISSAEADIPGISMLLQNCWHENPTNRPTAEAMLTTISRFIRQRECGHNTISNVTPRPRSPPRMRRSVSVSSHMLISSPKAESATPPVMHEKPLSPSKLLEKSLERTPANSPDKTKKKKERRASSASRLSKWVPKMGFSVTPMQLVRQKSLLRSFSATIDVVDSEEKLEKGSELDCALKQAVMKRRKDFDMEEKECLRSPESPWAVEDQF